MKRIKGKILYSLKVAVSIALVYLVVDKIGFADVADSLKTLSVDLGLALLYSLLFTFLKVLKWHDLVLAGAGRGSAFWEGAKSYFIGMAGGLVTPGRVGEIARTVGLEKHKRSLIAYLVVVDRIFEIAAVLALALPGLFFYANSLVAGAALIVLAMLLAVIYFPEYPPLWLQRALEHSGKFAAVRQQLGLMEMQIAAISPRVKIKQLGLAFLSYGMVIMQFYHLLNNYHHCRLWTAILAQPLIMLTNVLPFTIGGLGIREGAAMVLLAPFGVPKAAAMSSAFMLFLLNTAMPAFIGALLLLLHREKKL